MPDIGSKDTHVIQALGKDGSWKNMTKHESAKDAKASLPVKNPDNYRVRTIAQASLSRSKGDAGNSSNTKAYQSGATKNTAVKAPVAKKPAVKPVAKPTAKAPAKKK